MAANLKITDWKQQRIWLIGASSGIGRALAHELHARGAHVIVSGRRQNLLDQFVQQHAGSQALALDVTQNDQLQHAWTTLARTAMPDLICYCVADYQPMTLANFDVTVCEQHLQINYLAFLRLLQIVVPQLRTGTHLSVMSSVAAYRGLPQSLAYGPSKAALQHLAEILYLELQARGVGVSLISPGFVDTQLTAKNQFAMPALLMPEDAAREIVRGWERGAFEIHFPKRFTWAMKLLRVLPYAWYFALLKRFLMPAPTANATELAAPTTLAMQQNVS